MLLVLPDPEYLRGESFDPAEVEVALDAFAQALRSLESNAARLPELLPWIEAVTAQSTPTAEQATKLAVLKTSRCGP